MGILNDSLYSVIEIILGLRVDEAIPCVQLVDGYDSENLKFVCTILGFQKDRGMGCRMPVVQIVLER